MSNVEDSAANFTHVAVAPGGSLPDEFQGDSLLVRQGFAVQAGDAPWYFFDSAPVAGSYALAVRQAHGVACVDGRVAAAEVRWDGSQDVHTLHLGPAVDLRDPELALQFARGMSTASSRWQAPA